MNQILIPNFSRFEHTYRKHTCAVYHGGNNGAPLVFLLHEIPNPTPEVFDLGRILIDEGYHVHIPVFFGTPNASYSSGTAMFQLAMGCIRKEFSVFASDSTSPVVDWLRSLCVKRMTTYGLSQVGMIGMCFTGNFALGLCAEEWMTAPVLSQPGLPYPLTKQHRKSLHIDPKDLQIAKSNQDLEILGLRFTNDWMCPKTRFDTLRAHFGDRFEGIEIDSSPTNEHGIKTTAHSVLTLDLVNKRGHPTQDALNRVLTFLNQRLRDGNSV